MIWAREEGLGDLCGMHMRDVVGIGAREQIRGWHRVDSSIVIRGTGVAVRTIIVVEVLILANDFLPVDGR